MPKSSRSYLKYEIEYLKDKISLPSTEQKIIKQGHSAFTVAAFT